MATKRQNDNKGKGSHKNMGELSSYPYSHTKCRNTSHLICVWLVCCMGLSPAETERLCMNRKICIWQDRVEWRVNKITTIEMHERSKQTKQCWRHACRMLMQDPLPGCSCRILIHEELVYWQEETRIRGVPYRGTSLAQSNITKQTLWANAHD